MVIFENVTLETSIDRPKPAEVGDNAALVLKMMSGVLAVVETSWTQIATLEGTSLYGTKGTLLLNSLNVPVMAYKQSSWIVPSLAKKNEPRHTHSHFVRCILEDPKPTGTVAEGRHVVEVLEAAYEAARSGETIAPESS